MKKISAPILEISNLCKKEKNKTIDRLNLIIPSGESVAVMYKNDDNIGLLCDILKGRKKCDKGKLFFKSRNITGEKNIFGVVEKEPDIPKTRSVIDFACTSIVKRGLSKKMTSVLVQKELHSFELSEYGNETISHLPKRLIKRAELFGAYMCSHELIAIDEPFNGLSDDEREGELTLFENVKKKYSMSVLLFTKNIELAVRLADSVVVADNNTQSAGIISVDRKKLDRTTLKIKELYDSV